MKSHFYALSTIALLLALMSARGEISGEKGAAAGLSASWIQPKPHESV